MGHAMELRHLRYFVAVAEEGSLSVAAERRLHTAQPSLSRQIRDLEYEVGAQLMIRSARGIELTAAGRVFLDHARLALAQVDAAGEAARRAAQPAKPSFALGFLTGKEIDWLPEAIRLLRDELPNIEIRPDPEADNMAMAMSFVASTHGVALLPAYARNLLPSSLISRPLQGDAPTIDLVVGYSRMNASPILKLFLSRIDDLIARVSKKTH